MKPVIAPLLAAAVVCVAGLASPPAAYADANVYRQTLKSTAWVLAKSGGETSSGTGVLVDQERRLLITNFHVVGDARSAVIFFPEIKDGRPVVDRNSYLKNVRRLGVRGRIIGVDRKRDLALIELDRIPTGIQAITLAAESAGTGESVQSIGNSGSSEALWVFTSGDVRNVYQKQFRTGAGEHDFMTLETQSPINPGDSGGPVVNERGELVGICQSLSPKARLVTYCVDVSEVKTFLADDWKPAPLPVVAVLDRADLNYNEVEEDTLEVKFEQEDETEQSVYINTEIEYFEQADVRKIWSLAATLDAAPDFETTMKLLQETSRTKFGSWSIEKTEEGKYLVIYVCKIDATATSRALRSTMEYVARLANLAKDDLKPKTAVATQDPAGLLNDWLAD